MTTNRALKPYPPSDIQLADTSDANVPFFDDFDDNSLDGTKWARLGAVSGFAVNETSQQLQIVTGANAGVDGLVTVSAFDQTDRSWTLEAIDTWKSGKSNYLIAIDNTGKYFGFVVTIASGIAFEYNNGSNSFTSTAYNSTAHRWLRLRHETAGNRMLWQTSPDGITWTTQRTVTSWSTLGFNMASIKFRFQINASAAATQTFIYDNISLSEN